MSEPTLQEPIDISAMFLGPKSENEEFLLRLVREVLQDHVYWRRNLFVDDEPAISAQQAARLARADVHAHIVQEVYRLTSRLKSEVPFFSPRYLGHMLSDPLLPAVIGTVAALLYNPNNVSAEGSVVTSRLELEVGQQLGRLMGFHETSPAGRLWGHITSGGTVANLEAFWTALSVKYHPLAVRNAARSLGQGALAIHGRPAAELTVWEALNVPMSETLELSARLATELARARGHERCPRAVAELVDQTIRQHSLAQLGHCGLAERHAAEGGLPAVVLLLPETRHYGWLKVPEIFGIGHDAVVTVPTDASFRQDMGAYEELLHELNRQRQTPVMSVAVVGTTEESAVDPVAEMVALRERFAREGLCYVLHCDAAWGGYARAVFLDRTGRFKSLAELRARFGSWPTEPVYDAFRALAEVDSVTIDPHKMGYVPYPAGALVFRDGRAKELVGHDAPYVFDGRSDDEAAPLHLGRYIIEGSKPGTAAAAVWLSHHVFPLDELGYGHLIGHTILAAKELAERLTELGRRLDGQIELLLVNPSPDLNVLCYAFNPRGNGSLARMNRFNRMLYRTLGVRPGAELRAQQFFVSHTELRATAAAAPVLRMLLEHTTSVAPASLAVGPLPDDAEPEGAADRIFVLRTTLMNPFVTEPAPGGSTLEKFVAALSSQLEKTLEPWSQGAPG